MSDDEKLDPSLPPFYERRRGGGPNTTRIEAHGSVGSKRRAEGDALRRRVEKLRDQYDSLARGNSVDAAVKARLVDQIEELESQLDLLKPSE